MASVAARPNKPRKDNNSGPSNAQRRGGGWRGSTGTHYSPNFNNTRLPTPPQNAQGNNFPPLSHQNPPPQDRWVVLLLNFIGASIIVTTRAGARHEGVLAPAEPEGSGVLLKDVKDLTQPNAPPKESAFFPWTQVSMWQPSEPQSAPPNHINGQATPPSFRTDTDISSSSIPNGPGPRRERELHAWKADGTTPAPPSAPSNGLGSPLFTKQDDETFGATAQNGSWDQFAVNEHLFGVTATFDEDAYTTKLDRSAPDYKERERKAARIANEIMSTTSANPHLAEERGQVDDSGANEEDKYGAVVRGANAYIPPGARKTTLNGTAPTGSPTPDRAANSSSTKPDVPKVSINGPDGAVVPRSPPPVSINTNLSSKPSGTSDNNLVGTFREFVTKEKQRLVQKKHDIVKNDMDKRIQDLKKFSVNFKLSKPIPEDLVSILTKDEEKQKHIIEKSVVDAQSANARSIGSLQATPANPLVPSPPTSTRLPPGSPVSVKQPTTPGRKPTSEAKVAPNANANGTTNTPANVAPKSQKAEQQSRRPHMVIQAIPPFNREKRLTVGDSSGNLPSPSSSAVPPASPTASVNSSTSNTFKLNVNASSFRPNPNASAFKPSGAPTAPPSSVGATSPKQNAVNTPPPSNPFFGALVIKKTAVNIKEDFNPFKAAKMAEAAVVGPMWPYTGKRYMQTFPPLPHAPPMQAPPPPSYEEDSAAQAALRAGPYSMMYAYPPYQYQPTQQPMMAVQTSAPPAGYMPSPFMPQLPYPPQLPPNGPPTMYGPPQMGNMPPTQAYLPPPPPGAYPPNGAPRGSMPPTPMPPHAYAYHQSPQLSHAVPYPMMMQQPTQGGQPHPYENQVPPGPGAMGVGH